MRLAEVRLPRAGLIAVAASLLAVAILVYWSRRLLFFSDEWSVISELPGAGSGYYFEPHNEHWATLLKLIYRVLLGTFGMRTYTPYMAVLAALHAGAGLCLFGLVRHRSGELLALGATLLFLFLGRGYEDLVWAFQIGFVGAVACGLGALLLLDLDEAAAARLAAASVLLLASLMFQGGIGLVFLGAAGVELLLDPGRRSRLVALAAPVVAYATWFGLFGRASLAIHRSPFSAEAGRSLIDYVPRGVGAAAAGFASLSATWSDWALAALSALVVTTLVIRRRPDPRVLGPLAGLIALFVLSGLVRGQFGLGQAAASRYIYVAGAFVALLATEAAGELVLGRLGQVVLGVVVLAAAAHGGSVLFQSYRAWAATEAAQKAELQALGAVRYSPDLDRQAVVDPDQHILITIDSYFRAVDAYGAPAPAVDGSGLARLPADSVNRALDNGFRSRLTIEPAPPLRGCQRVDPDRGFVDVPIDGGRSLGFSEDRALPVAVYLYYAGPPPLEPTAQLRPIGVYSRIHVPDAGLPGAWTLRLQPAPNLPAAICSAPG